LPRKRHRQGTLRPRDHAASPRHYNPLVVIHCGALAETLLESELFAMKKARLPARSTAKRAA